MERPLIEGSTLTAVTGAPGSTALRALEAQRRAIELLQPERTSIEALAECCRLVEQHWEGGLCAVMLWDKTGGRLRLAAAPSLPAAAQSDLLEMMPGPGSLSCGVALERRRVVVASAIAEDPSWLEHREAFLALGLHACWSVPLRQEGQEDLLGTFDFYFASERDASETELEALAAAGDLVSAVIVRSRALELLQQQSNFDSLTGLPNRSLFGQRLRDLVEAERRRAGDHRFAVIAVDIDQLKNINDTLGFNMGDFTLRAIGQRLQSCVRKDDTVARASGDEFLLLVRDIHRNEDVSLIADKIRARINAPYEFDGQGLFVTSTIGISVYPWDGEDAQTLLRNAETALHHAKDLGGSSYQLFRPTMVRNRPTFDDWWRRSKLTADLRDALANDQLELYYQLKFETSTQKVCGAEALMRWNHPELGLLAPGKFIPMAEQTGMIVQIGAWALRTAARQNRQWQDLGLLRIPVSVNVTAHQFRRGDLIDIVKQSLQETSLEARYLELEITESIAMEDGHQSLQRLQALSDLGILLSIDDFGTGFSSLSYLNRFPIDALKVDRSFIKDIGTGGANDGESRSIVMAVLSIASALKLKVVAEGVETQAQFDFLKEHKCHQVQGFLLARPRTAHDVTQSLIKRS